MRESSGGTPVYRRYHSGGFTVVELLVASAVTVVIAGLMLTVAAHVLNNWNRSIGTLTAESEARIALDQLTFDLQGALYRHDGGAWLAATVEDSLDGSEKPPPDPSYLTTGELVHSRFGVGGMFLRLFTTQIGVSASGPEAVGYKIGYQSVSTSTNAEKRYRLFRTEVSPAVTLAAGYEIEAASYEGLGTPVIQQVIADNVIDFGVRLYAHNQTDGGLVLLYPTKDNGGTTYLARSSAGTPAGNRFPDIADVMVRILTEEGARRIRACETNPTPGADWWTIALANSRVFTRRVELHPSPL